MSTNTLSYIILTGTDSLGSRVWTSLDEGMRNVKCYVSPPEGGIGYILNEFQLEAERLYRTNRSFMVGMDELYGHTVQNILPSLNGVEIDFHERVTFSKSVIRMRLVGNDPMDSTNIDVEIRLYSEVGTATLAMDVNALDTYEVSRTSHKAVALERLVSSYLEYLMKRGVS